MSASSFSFDYSFFAERRAAAIVVSHERSGTHFHMNALANCYGYVAQPWINFDLPETNINYFRPKSVSEHLLSLASRPLANVVKSHHAVDFFASELPRITERYVVLSVCRHPVSVTLSFWRFLERLPWHEGPKVPDPLSLARSEPWGAMRRYHLGQYANLMRRWAAHVEGWCAAAASQPGIAMVRYEDLDTRYEETMSGLAPILGRVPGTIVRPPRVDVIAAGQLPLSSSDSIDTAALEQFCREEVGDTMSRLRYS